MVVIPSTKAEDTTVNPHTVASTENTQPLTKANLRLLQHATGAEAMIHLLGSASASKAAEMSPASDRSKLNNVVDIRNSLSYHRFLINDHIAQIEYCDFLQSAKELILGERGSETGPDAQEAMLSIRAANALQNEDTFIDNFWFALLHPARQVRDPNDDAWISQTWAKDHLGHHRNKPFKGAGLSLPLLKPETRILKELIALSAKIKNPQPDILYGIDKLAFTFDEHHINQRYAGETRLSDGQFHSFFVIEFKNSEGSMEDAKNQACRTGAAMVAATRRLYGTVANVDGKGADKRSFVFSLAITTTLAQMFVNWAAVDRAGQVTYHMHRLAGYELEDGLAISRLKHDVDNVLDWGTLKRVHLEIKPLLEAIARRP